jgi:hypothetical protein
MAGFSDSMELSILQLLLNATAIANIADNASSSPLTNVYVALHTADPTDSGAPTASEATYTGYGRVTVARTSGGWTCATATGTTTAKNTAIITFGACTAGSNTITHASIVTTTSGAGTIIASGALTASLAVSAGINSIVRCPCLSSVT